MDNIVGDASNSDCEFVFESEVGTNTNTKEKTKQRHNKSKKKKASKLPCAPNVIELPSIPTKRKRSPWWKHFRDTPDPDIAECIYCERYIGCASKSGTAPLKNHVSICKQCPFNIDKKQNSLTLSLEHMLVMMVRLKL